MRKKVFISMFGTIRMSKQGFPACATKYVKHVEKPELSLIDDAVGRNGLCGFMWAGTVQIIPDTGRS